MRRWLRAILAADSPQPPPEPASPPGLPEHYFEIYSLAVEMADRISARRVVANSFFATVHTALIALFGSKDFPWYVAIAGVVLSLVWWALLKSYRDLNAAKFHVINELEKRLPAKIFTDEWAKLKGDEGAIPAIIPRKGIRGWLSQYRELGAVERVVPWMFAAIYAINLVLRIDWSDVPDCWRVWE